MIYVTVVLVVVNHNLLNFPITIYVISCVLGKITFYVVSEVCFMRLWKTFCSSIPKPFLTTWAKLFTVAQHSHSLETTYHLFNILRTLYPYQYFARSLS